MYYPSSPQQGEGPLPNEVQAHVLAFCETNNKNSLPSPCTLLRMSVRLAQPSSIATFVVRLLV
jgi:hypothetical protein